MFLYSSSKDSLWGHSMRPKVTLKAIEKTVSFLNTYFDPIRPKQLTLILNRYQDKEELVPKLREKAIQVFGRSGTAESLNWIFAPTDYQKVVDFILSCDISPKLPSDPIWLSFECRLVWKKSVLPNFEASDGVFGDFWDCNEMTATPIFKINLRFGGRLMFPMGLLIPVSSHDSGSYDFLGKFSADAPMKMNPKHFLVFTIGGKRATKAWRKPDSDIVANLQEVIV
jgi:hypothetical protein